jgi:hypothetical protein
MLAARYDDTQLAVGQCLGRKERHNCSVIGTRQKRRMAIPQATSANALLADDSGSNKTANSAASKETNVAAPHELFVANRVLKTNAQEKEAAATRREVERQVNVDVGNQTTAQSRAVHRENPSTALERRQTEAAAEKHQAAAGEQGLKTGEEEMPPANLQVTDPEAEVGESAD